MRPSMPAQVKAVTASYILVNCKVPRVLVGVRLACSCLLGVSGLTGYHGIGEQFAFEDIEKNPQSIAQFCLRLFLKWLRRFTLHGELARIIELLPRRLCGVSDKQPRREDARQLAIP